MLKRILTIFLVVSLMGTAFVNVISAAVWPSDNSHIPINSVISMSHGSNVRWNTAPFLETGIPVFFHSTKVVSEGYFSSHTVSFSVPSTSTVWVGAYNNAGTWTPNPNTDVGSLSQYYDQSLSFEGSLTYNYRYNINSSNGFITTTNQNISLSTFVACFKDVPAGTYSFSYTPNQRYCTLAIFVDSTAGGSGGGSGGDTPTEPDPPSTGSSNNVYYPMGDERVTLWGQLLDAINSFDGSAESRNTIYTKIDAFSSWGDLLGISMADYALNLFSEKSGLFSGVVADFITNAEDILNLYNNNQLDSSQSAYRLSDLFSAQLVKCGTVSEALFLSSVYQAWNQKLLIICLSFDTEPVVFDNPITATDKEVFTSHEQKEQALVSLFNLEQYKAHISVNNFTSSLSSNSTSQLRAWFDYIINDSFFSPFITIPVSLLLVTSILGTSIVIIRRHRGRQGGID